MKNFLIFTVFSFSLFILGCASVNVSETKENKEQTVQNAYIFKAFIINADESALKEMGLAPNSGPMDFADISDSKKLAEISEKTGVQVVDFPELNINPGENKEVKNEVTAKYPKSFNAEGNPVEFEEKTTGRSLFLDFSNISEGSAHLKVNIKNITGPFYKKEKLENNSVEVDKPFFHTQEFNIKTAVSLNKWMAFVVSGNASSRENHTVFAFALKKTRTK